MLECLIALLLVVLSSCLLMESVQVLVQAGGLSIPYVVHETK